MMMDHKLVMMMNHKLA
jgi:hypothetical protein